MIGTVGLTIQTISPDFRITQGAAQNSREKLSLLSKKSSAAADYLVVQGSGVLGVKYVLKLNQGILVDLSSAWSRTKPPAPGSRTGKVQEHTAKGNGS